MSLALSSTLPFQPMIPDTPSTFLSPVQRLPLLCRPPPASLPSLITFSSFPISQSLSSHVLLALPKLLDLSTKSIQNSSPAMSWPQFSTLLLLLLWLPMFNNFQKLFLPSLISTHLRKPLPVHLLHPNHSSPQKFVVKNPYAPDSNQYSDPQSPRPIKKTDRKSTLLNSSHVKISYAVFCLKKKKTTHPLYRKIQISKVLKINTYISESK